MVAAEAESQKTGLELRLFGPLEVRVAGFTPSTPLARRGRWLLALLALRAGRTVSRDWLSATLWPESSEERALYNLRRMLTHLRDFLGPEAWRLQAEPPRLLRLDLSGAACDFIRFDECLAGGRPLFEEGVALYRGPLLEECAEEWVLPERAAREQAYLRALESLAAEALQSGEAARAGGYLRRILATDPLRESAHRQLMEALAAGGDRAAALQVYRDLRLLLHREIHAAPSPETVAVFERVKVETRNPAPAMPPTVESGTAPGRPGSLPMPLSSLVGRDREAAEIRRRLEDERLVTLTGAGGVGKTRLALRVAHEAADRFAGGAWFVDLTAVDDPAGVSRTVATVLGVRDGKGPLVEALVQALAGRPTLLVLDNCEHLVAGCADLVAALLSRCADLRVLATSQQPLGLAGESRWRVPSLPLPPIEEPPATPSQLLEYGAIRLFVERARQVRAEFHLTPENTGAVLRVCRHLDGLPLALELAAARTNVMSPEQVAARLAEHLHFLKNEDRSAPPRQRTLRAALEWSCGLLQPAEGELLRRLTVFSGGCSLEAAETVCADGAGEGSGGPVLDLLSHLVDRSLLVFEVEDAPRYRLLETVRQYAGEQLRKSGEEETLRSRHADYFLQRAEALGKQTTGFAQATTLRALEQEHANLRAAAEYLQRTGRTEAVLRLAVALAGFWKLRGLLREGRHRLETALDQSDPVASPLRARAVLALGVLAAEQDDVGTAERCYLESQGMLETLGMAPQLALCLNSLGILNSRRGDQGMARAYLERALALNRERGDRDAQALNLYNLAIAEYRRGDYEACRRNSEAALRLRRETGDLGGQAENLTALGQVAAQSGHLGQAEELCQEALRIAQEAGLHLLSASCLEALGRIAWQRGKLDAAEARLLACVEIRSRSNHRTTAYGSLFTLGLILADRGEWERAAVLISAADAGRTGAGHGETEEQQREREQALAEIRRAMGPARFQAAWLDGSTMSFDQVCTFATTRGTYCKHPSGRIDSGSSATGSG